MPERHVIFACELGSGRRQIDRILPVAAGLIAAGHRVSVAMPEGMSAGFTMLCAKTGAVTPHGWNSA